MHSDHLQVSDSQKDKEITPATPQSAESFTLTHESELLGGEMLDLAIDGDYAYAAVGVRGIDIFDISNPSSPRKINTWNEGTEIFKLYILDSSLIVVDREDGIYSLDISNPLELSLQSTVFFTYIIDVTFNEDTLCVYQSDDLIWCVNLVDPINPQKKGAYNPTNWVYEFEMYEDMLIISYSDYLEIVNISSQSSLQLLTTYTPEGYYVSIQNIAVYENCVYWTDYSGLKALNITDPLLPSIISEISLYFDVYDLEIIDSYLFFYAIDTYFVGEEYYLNYTLVMNNITNMGEFDEILTRNLEDIQISDIEIEDDYLFMAFDSSGLEIYEITDAPALQFRSSYDDYGIVYECISGDEFLYVGTEYGLEIFDISSTKFPMKISDLQMDHWGSGMMKYKNYIVFLSGLKIEIIDVSDPYLPSIVETIGEDYEYIMDYDSDENYLFVLKPDYNDDGPIAIIEVYEFNENDEFSYLIAYEYPGDYTVIVVENELLYTWDTSGIIHIIDISNILIPDEVGQIECLEMWRSAIAVDNDVLYYGNWYDKVKIFNLDDISAPTEVGSYFVTPVDALCISYPYLFVASETHDGDSELRVLNVKDETNPVLEIIYEVDGYIHEVKIVNNSIYLLKNRYGLEILNSPNIFDPNANNFGFLDSIPGFSVEIMGIGIFITLLGISYRYRQKNRK